MKSVVKYLFCHGLTLLTGLILGIVLTLACVYRDELLCLLNSYNFWSGLGAMLAGVGTVCLFILALIKSDEWLIQRNYDRDELLTKTAHKVLLNLYAIRQLTEKDSEYIKTRKSYREDLIKSVSEAYQAQVQNSIDEYAGLRSQAEDHKKVLENHETIFLSDYDPTVEKYRNEACEKLLELDISMKMACRSKLGISFKDVFDATSKCTEIADISDLEKIIKMIEEQFSLH